MTEPIEQSIVTGVRAQRITKKRKVRAVVFPKEGGRPYTVDVEPDEKGLFQLAKDHPGMYQIQRGSVWEEGGTLRAIVNEGNPLTVNAYALVDPFDPIALNGVASNNLWEQYAAIQRRKSAWRSAGTWGMIGMAVLIVLALVWLVKTTGGGFEDVREAIENLRLSLGDGGGAAAPTPTDAGHNDIAPGGS